MGLTATTRAYSIGANMPPDTVILVLDIGMRTAASNASTRIPHAFASSFKSSITMFTSEMPFRDFCGALWAIANEVEAQMIAAIADRSKEYFRKGRPFPWFRSECHF